MRTLVENLSRLASLIGSTTSLEDVKYYENYATMTHDELNRIEEWTDKIRDLIQNTVDGRRKLQFNLGIKEEF